jgi:hypothetical protein
VFLLFFCRYNFCFETYLAGIFISAFVERRFICGRSFLFAKMVEDSKDVRRTL